MAKTKVKSKATQPVQHALRSDVPPEVQYLIDAIKNVKKGKKHALQRLRASGIIDENGDLTDTYTKPQGVSRADSRVYLRRDGE